MSPKLGIVAWLTATLILLCVPATAAADSAALVAATKTAQNQYLVTINTSHDQCQPYYCGWFPVSHWVNAGESCPATSWGTQYIAVGNGSDYAGSESTTGTIYSAATSFVFCAYTYYDGSYHLVASIPWTDPTAAAPPQSTTDDESAIATMSIADARYYTKDFLRSKYGRKYTRGRGFRQRCYRNSRIQFRCAVTWKRKGTYRGNLWHTGYVKDGEQWIHSRSKIAFHKKKKKRHSSGGGGGGGGNCDPSYPTVCIAPPPPDLDCPEVPYTNFKVVGSDPHGFDGDGDGVGCEE